MKLSLLKFIISEKITKLSLNYSFNYFQYGILDILFRYFKILKINLCIPTTHNQLFIKENGKSSPAPFSQLLNSIIFQNNRKNGQCNLVKNNKFQLRNSVMLVKVLLNRRWSQRLLWTFVDLTFVMLTAANNHMCLFEE